MMVMKQKSALQLILALGLAGTAFSGVLTFQELTCGSSCAIYGDPLFSLPYWLYGFVLFGLTSYIAYLGWQSKK